MSSFRQIQLVYERLEHGGVGRDARTPLAAHARDVRVHRQEAQPRHVRVVAGLVLLVLRARVASRRQRR